MVRLCRLTLVVQAAVLDGSVFDAPPFGQDGFAAIEVDISRCQVADALVVAAVVVLIDEGGGGGLKFAFEEVVLQKNAVLEGLVPALDLPWVWGCIEGTRTCVMPLSSRYSARSAAI